MTYALARGQTAKEMCQLLRICRLTYNVHTLFDGTLASLNAARGRYILNLANVSRIAVSYLTVIQLASSSSTLAATPRELPTISINGLRTVSPTDVEGAALALTNAIYFKRIRKCPFDPDRTTVAPFRVSSSESTQVNMMTQTARFRYSLNRRLNCQIIELP